MSNDKPNRTTSHVQRAGTNLICELDGRHPNEQVRFKSKIFHVDMGTVFLGTAFLSSWRLRGTSKSHHGLKGH